MLATAYPSAETSMPSQARRHLVGHGSSSRADAFAGSLPRGSARIVGAKDHVYCEGDAATHVYRVEFGHVCIYRMLADGRRQVIDFAYPGDLIGLGDLGEHAASAQATERSRLSCYTLTSVWEHARNDIALGLKLYQAMAYELAAARDLLMTVSQRSACERVAGFLLALSRRNQRRGQNADEIVLPMTRTDIADFLGLTIETVSRTFTKFRVEGLIDLEQCILVTIRDHAVLQHVATGARARDIKLAS
jgi:CRP/FNR family transcriptional regulator, anaerobic regulatory protein